MSLINSSLTALRQSVSRFSKDQRGNFAMLFAFTSIPCLVVLGGAVDIARVTTAKSVLDGALEAAVLSAASLNNDRAVADIINEYVEANLTGGVSGLESLSITIDTQNVSESSKEIGIKATAKVPSTFLVLAGIDEMEINASSTAYQAARKLEISLVLDISSSMRGTKLTNLKQAATQFVDEIVDNSEGPEYVSFNLIPYGGTVNIGSLFDKFVVKLAADIPADMQFQDPDSSIYKVKTEVENGRFRFSDGLDCLEYKHDDYDDTVLPEGKRPQVPHHWVWYSTNPWCPPSESEIFLNTKDFNAVKTRIDDMVLSDGTGSDIGVLWGMKALSPEWKDIIDGDFPDRPAAYSDEDTLKIMVFMTDGGITKQIRPIEFVDGLSRAKGSASQTSVKKGSYANDYLSDTAYGRLKKSCRNLDNYGVRVYTIGFKIKATSDAAKQMEDCASNGGSYYLVEDLDISKAFSAISADIANLRISG